MSTRYEATGADAVVVQMAQPGTWVGLDQTVGYALVFTSHGNSNGYIVECGPDIADVYRFCTRIAQAMVSMPVVSPEPEPARACQFCGANDTRLVPHLGDDNLEDGTFMCREGEECIARIEQRTSIPGGKL